jgi:HEAT repeat protein
MTRWILVLLFATGLVAATTLPSLVTPAQAQFDVIGGGDNGGATNPPAGGNDNGGDNKTPATEDNTTPATDDNGGGTPAAGGGEENPTPEPPAPPKPTKQAIRAMVAEGKALEAEQQYLDWASYWHEDEPALIAIIEHAVLLQLYRDGKFAALMGMVQAGDPEARDVLRAVVLSSGNELKPEDYAKGIRLMGEFKEQSTLNTLRLLIYHENPTIVLAAIDAMGNLGDKRVVNDLLTLFDDADLERSVHVAAALRKLGAAKQVRTRFVAMLKYPQAGDKERAALTLAAAGCPEGWTTVHQMLVSKMENYYPLVVTTLIALPSEESRAFVERALNGNEAEILAGLQCIDLLPAARIDAALLDILRDADRPLAARLETVRLLMQRRTAGAIRDFRTLAATLDDDDMTVKVSETTAKVDPAVKAAAMTALPLYLDIYDPDLLEMVRERVRGKNEAVALAARVALYQYAINPPVVKKKKR